MRHEFRLADIGEGLEEAEIISWLVAVGDEVRRDQPLVEVMTDKSNAELPAPAEGKVVELNGAVGDIVQVGQLIAVIESDALSPASGSPEVSPPATPAVVGASAQVPHAERPPAALPAEPEHDHESQQVPRETRPKAAPSTRRAAAERGIDLATVTGSGPGGRILLADLDAAVQPSPAHAAPAPDVTQTAVRPATGDEQTAAILIPQPTPSTNSPTRPTAPTGPLEPPASAAPLSVGSRRVPLRGVRRAVARNMARSWSEIPHIHAFRHIDAEPLLTLRSRLRESKRDPYVALTPLAFFVAAVARALATHPEANASIDMDDETLVYHGRVNVGVAVATEHGLVVPVLQGADQLDFETLSVALTELVRGARAGELSREHFLSGTVTITNFGSLGGEQATPLIRPPEAMILGFGSIASRPFVIDDELVARKTMHLVAGADHRLLDGDSTTAVLSEVARLLSDPLDLVI